MIIQKAGQRSRSQDPKIVCDTLPFQDAFTREIWNSYRRCAPDLMQFLETRSEVKQGHRNPIMVRDTSSSQDASTHQI